MPWSRGSRTRIGTPGEAPPLRLVPARTDIGRMSAGASTPQVVGYLGHVPALAEHLRRILSDDTFRARVREAAGGATPFSPDAHTTAVARALEQVVGCPTGR